MASAFERMDEIAAVIKEVAKLQPGQVGPTTDMRLDRPRFDGRRIIQVPVSQILDLQGPIGLVGKTIHRGE